MTLYKTWHSLIPFFIPLRFCCIFFFFYRYGDHLHLHSFPTRRSSDLSSWRVASQDESSGCPSSTGPRRIRSEEHTSELQSLRHLVCRLLLEKKKKMGKQHFTQHSLISIFPPSISQPLGRNAAVGERST